MQNLKYCLMITMIILLGINSLVLAQGQESTPADKRLDIGKVKIMLNGEVFIKRIITLINERGFKFDSENQTFDDLTTMGGDDQLIYVLESTKHEWLKVEIAKKEQEEKKRIIEEKRIAEEKRIKEEAEQKRQAEEAARQEAERLAEERQKAEAKKKGHLVSRSTDGRYEVYKPKGDKVIKDTKMGLMWTPDIGKKGLNWDETKAVVEGLNRQRYGGYSDWRLPTREEITGIYEENKEHKPLDYPNDSYTIKIDPVFDYSGYWSWSGESEDLSSAWNFFFSSGRSNGAARSNDSNVNRVLAVRSES